MPVMSSWDGAVPEPKQQRGRQRVAAVLDTAARLFGEKGFDKTTMTEIAAQSGTAIGSLYRFFPSKEAIADTLLQRFTRQVAENLVVLRRRSASMSLDNLADALVDFSLEFQAQRSFALNLVDAIGGSQEKKLQFRNVMRHEMAGLLRQALPALDETRALAMTVMVLHLLKLLTGLRPEDIGLRLLLVAEIRQLLRLYLRCAPA